MRVSPSKLWLVIVTSVGGSLQHQAGARPHQVRSVYIDSGHPRQFPAPSFSRVGNTRAINSPQGASHCIIHLAEKDDATEMCEPQNREIARMTRRVFHEAIAKHVVGERYGRKESQRSHRSDMAMLMVPRLRSGKYLNLIRDSDVGKTGGFIRTADLMKEKLWRGVIDLVERVIVAKRARDGGMAMNGSSKQQNQHQGPSGSGQISLEPDEEEVGNDRSFALAGLFMTSTKIPTDFAKCYSWQNACQFWAQHGNLAQHMKHVSQALLGKA